MNLPDGTVLLHSGTPYNPQKAREYYLRTRQLKGRKSRSPDLNIKALNKAVAGTYTVQTTKNTSITVTAKQLKEQKLYIAKRVSAITTKLHKLESELRKRMAEAKKAEAKAKQGPTSAEKAANARDAVKYRDKHKQKLATAAKTSSANSTSNPTQSIDMLTASIAQVRTSLKEAVAKQRSLSTAIKAS